MRVPVSWLAELVDLPEGISGREIASALVDVGLEVEAVDEVAADLSGPLVVGRVLEFSDEPQSNGKTIRWCQVDIGNQTPQGIVCGAANFEVGDAVVVVLPGAILPGGFAITARKTYGHVSDGMICSVRELGLGDEHLGILVLSEADLGGARPGDDARGVLGIPDTVLDVEVTPDRGYCMSVRGLAREVATALGVAFRDPADRKLPAPEGEGWPVVLADPTGCDRFVARTVTGVDPAAPSPLWLRRRLSLLGMRPLSIAVDITNYVMLELGQPIHGYDHARLAGPIVVRRARPGETIETLDGSVRTLDPADLIITDDSGAIGVAGVMGGASTELSESTTDVVIEAAHFAPLVIARAARRHRLPSEASRRFERGVDDDLAAQAADRVSELLCSLAGGVAAGGVTDVDLRPPRPGIAMAVDFPTRLVGVELDGGEVERALRSVGCEVTVSGDQLLVLPPSWRPDLVARVDLVEEVARLHGYMRIPSTPPTVPVRESRPLPGRHVTRVGRALAGAGHVEVKTYPFVGEPTFDALGYPAGDDRRHAVRLANPLSEQEPFLRTTLLAGLLVAARRNTGRGFTDLALFETGAVYRPKGSMPPYAPRLGADRRPTEAELAQLDAGLPDQPVHAAVVLTGAAEPPGWWGAGRPAIWADAVAAARTIARSVDVSLHVRAAALMPWHPGRCAELVAGEGTVVGHAGELHPRVCAALGLPPRTCAAELSLTAMTGAAHEPAPAPHISGFPVATQDVALVVDADVPAADVEAALRAGAGPLLESVRLFDVYTGEQVGAGRRSLAYSLRFRATDRTLTAEEASAARDAAVEEAARRVGAVPRR